MTVNAVGFYVFAALAVAGAIGVVGLPQLRLAAYALAGMGAAVGLLYLVLGNELLFAAQVLVGALAVPAVVLLALDLTKPRRGAAQRAAYTSWWPVAAVAALGLAALLLAVAAVSGGAWVKGSYPSSDQGVTLQMGRLVFTRFALPFGTAAVLLLTALVGAVVTGRRDDLEEELEAAEEARRRREERMRRRREDRERARRRPAAVGARGDGEGE